MFKSVAVLLITAPVAMGAVGAIENDPSLAIRTVTHATTAWEYLPEVVLAQDNVVLTWDARTETFDLMLGESVIEDLVTTTDERGYPSFSGMWSASGEPLVYGSVIVGAAFGENMIEVSRPGKKPIRYHTGAANAPAPDKCDCANGTNFCVTHECNDEVICTGAETAICKWIKQAED